MMQLGEHLAALRPIAAVAAEKAKPLSVDFQDVYGEKLKDGVRASVQMGVVVINLEDCDKETEKMMPVEVAAERVQEGAEDGGGEWGAGFRGQGV
jgi:2-methylisocitrate lyase-like PEP mutase family enzyme